MQSDWSDQNVSALPSATLKPPLKWGMEGDYDLSVIDERNCPGRRAATCYCCLTTLLKRSENWLPEVGMTHVSGVGDASSAPMSASSVMHSHRECSYRGRLHDRIGQLCSVFAAVRIAIARSAAVPSVDVGTGAKRRNHLIVRQQRHARSHSTASAGRFSRRGNRRQRRT